ADLLGDLMVVLPVLASRPTSGQPPRGTRIMAVPPVTESNVASTLGGPTTPLDGARSSAGGTGPEVPASAREQQSRARILHGPLAWSVARFGVPLVVGMFLYTLFNLIDMFMISRLEGSEAALGALAICDMVAALATIVSNGISTGTVAIIARRMGEG